MEQEDAWDYQRRTEQILSKFNINDLGKKVGDLSGGQMISKKVPVKRYYDFLGKGKEYKRIVKEIINEYLNTYQINVMAELTYCFESATELFKEMNEIGKPLVLTNEVFDENNRDTENDPFKGTSIEGKD